MSKSTSNLFLLCLGSVFFACASCKRVSNNEIDATIFIKEYKTGIPIANAKVTILRGNPLTGYGTQFVAEMYSDADGKVLFNEDVDKAYEYFADATRDDLYPVNQQVILSRGKKGFETTVVKYVCGYVKIHLTNAVPKNENDIAHLNSYCDDYTFYGKNTDTTFFYYDNCGCGWFSNFTFHASVFTTTNNISGKVPFDFTPIPRDTISLEVSY